MKKINLLIPAVILLSGCTSLSTIEKESETESHFKNAYFAGSQLYIAEDEIVGERYRIYNEGVSTTSELKRKATAAANKFCAEQDENKSMLTVSEFGATPPYVWGNMPRIEIIFTCEDKSKPKAKSVTNVVYADKYDRLAKIKTLLDNGVLTEAEFAAEKKKILAEK